MLTELVFVWELFGNTYLAGWLAGLVLSFWGVLTLGRGQVFVGAAVSHLGLLGLSVGMFIGAVCQADAWLDFLGHAVSGIFAVGGLWFLGGFVRRSGMEAWVGWLYLFSASGAMVLLSYSPLALEEAQRLLTSTLIGASNHDVVLLSALLAIHLALLLKFFPEICLRAVDEELSVVQGLPTRLLQFAETLLLGITLALCIGVSGVLFTFGVLVLPALASKYYCREVGKMFLVAPLVFFIVSLPGFFLSHYLDVPPGPMLVFVLSLTAFGSAAIKRRVEKV